MDIVPTCRNVRFTARERRGRLEKETTIDARTGAYGKQSRLTADAALVARSARSLNCSRLSVLAFHAGFSFSLTRRSISCFDGAPVSIDATRAASRASSDAAARLKVEDPYEANVGVELKGVSRS